MFSVPLKDIKNCAAKGLKLANSDLQMFIVKVAMVKNVKKNALIFLKTDINERYPKHI